MIISHKYRYIFIKNRKVAGTSVEIYLNQYKNKEDVFTPITAYHDNHSPQNYSGTFNLFRELTNTRLKYARTSISDYRKQKKFWNHMPGLLIKSRIDPEIWDSYYKFTIERNPWDKIISHYHWIARNKSGEFTLMDYLENKFYPKDFDKYTDLNGSIIIDKVLRYENLDDELKTILHKLGIPFNGKLNIYAKSEYREDRSYHKFYDDMTRKIVADIFKEEIKEFNYKF